MTTPNTTTTIKKCTRCQTDLDPELLYCPKCHYLVHSDKIKAQLQTAKRYVQEGEDLKALQAYRGIIEYLPADSKQYQVLSQEIDLISRRVDSLDHHVRRGRSHMPEWLISLGIVGFLLWKFKVVVALWLTKGKLLLVGLTKAQTLFSMFVSIGVYWSIWGWKFAVGVVLSLYVHEMGHIFALKRFGIISSLPTFIPGIGALIRLKQNPTSPIEDARIGLAGPWWGLFAALVCAGVFYVTGWRSWGAVARVGAWLNLFNLLPLQPLDGGRGFRALVHSHRIVVCGVILGMWIYTREGLLLLLLVMAVIKLFSKSDIHRPDLRTLIEYSALIIILSLLVQIRVPV